MSTTVCLVWRRRRAGAWKICWKSGAPGKWRMEELQVLVLWSVRELTPHEALAVPRSLLQSPSPPRRFYFFFHSNPASPLPVTNAKSKVIFLAFVLISCISPTTLSWSRQTVPWSTVHRPDAIAFHPCGHQPGHLQCIFSFARTVAGSSPARSSTTASIANNPARKSGSASLASSPRFRAPDLSFTWEDVFRKMLQSCSSRHQHFFKNLFIW